MNTTLSTISFVITTEMNIDAIVSTIDSYCYYPIIILFFDLN